MGQERYAGKVAVVTGAASGIGEGITRRLVAEGASVVITDINEARLTALADELGPATRPLVADATSDEENAAMVALAVEEFGALHNAFHVAGTNRLGPIVDLDPEDWQFTVDTCLKSAFLGTRHAARQMIAQGVGGAIVNVASLNAVMPNHGSAAYCASKAGLVMFGKVAALELGEHRIRVNAVSPGLTDTPLARPLIDNPGAHEAFLRNIPLGVDGLPSDMASAALYLNSDDAGYVTGTNFLVDGGWSLAGYPDLRPWMDQLAADIGHGK